MTNEIKDVRKIRRDISRECEHDLEKVLAYYCEYEEQLKQEGEFRFEGSGSCDDGTSKARPKERKPHVA